MFQLIIAFSLCDDFKYFFFEKSPQRMILKNKLCRSTAHWAGAFRSDLSRHSIQINRVPRRLWTRAYYGEAKETHPGLGSLDLGTF